MKIKLHKLFFGCIFLAGWTASAQTNRVLTVSSGFNADVIANGIGSAASSTTIGVDNANYAFMSRDYQTTANSATYSNALPANGLITSAANSAIQFQLGPLTGNNSLRLQLTGNTGTVVFDNQLMATKLYVLATGGSGSVTMSTVVNFTDGTNQSATGSVIPDWYYSETLPVAASGIGRVSRGDNGVQNDFGNPRMYMFTINIATANQSKTVSSIQFTKTSAAEGVLNVFAVSAEAVPCITPPPPSAEAQAYCGVTTASQLTAAGTVTGGTFRWYTTATGGTALAPAAEVSSGVYYVSQVDNVCESTRVAADIIVNITPQPEGSTAQFLCPGSTISDLEGVGVEGGIVSWSYNQEVIPLGVAIQSGTYLVTQMLGNCGSVPKEVVVTVAVPEAPEASDQQTLCSGSIVGDIDASMVNGATANWVFIGFISEPVLATDALRGGRYSVTQSLNGCTSAATIIDVNVVDAPAEPGGEATQSFYVGETLSTLDITVEYEATISWFILTDEGEYESIPEDTFLEHNATYYVAQSFVTGCLSPFHAITATNALSRDNQSLKNLSVYPNPATNVVTVNNNEAVSLITVSNMLGQKVLSQLANASNVPVDITTLAAGTYILQVYTAQGTATVKVVKQ